MHDQILASLPNVEGTSHHVVAVFIDVRGFSKYAGHAESVETAVYLKKLYLAILNDYLAGVDFFKPTGDGLMVIFTFTEDTLREVVAAAVESCVKLLDAYPGFLQDDPMLSGEIPDRIGIGIALGAATSLSDGDVTIDFSGRPLNLAARLMDIARPEGIVLDHRAYLALDRDGPLVAEMTTDEVYVKGVADETCLEIHFWSKWTTVPDRLHYPTGEYEWVADGTVTRPLEFWAERDQNQLFELTYEPALKESILVKVEYPRSRIDGSKHPNHTLKLKFPATYDEDADGRRARIPAQPVVARLREQGVKDTWEVTMTAQYQIPKGMRESTEAES